LKKGVASGVGSGYGSRAGPRSSQRYGSGDLAPKCHESPTLGKSNEFHVRYIWFQHHVEGGQTPNFVLSPVSLHAVLSMLAMGARQGKYNLIGDNLTFFAPEKVIMHILKEFCRFI
jgi:hypothetical protein